MEKNMVKHGKKHVKTWKKPWKNMETKDTKHHAKDMETTMEHKKTVVRKFVGIDFPHFFRGINGIMGLHEGYESDNMGKTMGKTMGKMMGFYHHLMGLN